MALNTKQSPVLERGFFLKRVAPAFRVCSPHAFKFAIRNQKIQ
jgi:hypothetical protein